MTRFDRMETALFRDGPTVLLWVAAIFALTPVLLAGTSLFNEVGDWGAFAKVIAVACLPALLTFALSRALKARHVLTVPLTYALCFLSLWTIRGGFGSAIEGITPQWLLQPVLYLVTGLELAFIAFAAVFVTMLWRKGRFDGNRA